MGADPGCRATMQVPGAAAPLDLFMVGSVAPPGHEVPLIGKQGKAGTAGAVLVQDLDSPALYFDEHLRRFKGFYWRVPDARSSG